MAHTPEEVGKQIKTILTVGAFLLFFTAVTVGLSFVDFGSQSNNIAIGLALATFKSCLVVLFFMHMLHERPLIYKFMLFTMLFLGVMFTLFIVAHGDPLKMKDYLTIFGKH